MKTCLLLFVLSLSTFDSPHAYATLDIWFARKIICSHYASFVYESYFEETQRLDLNSSTRPDGRVPNARRLRELTCSPQFLGDSLGSRLQQPQERAALKTSRTPVRGRRLFCFSSQGVCPRLAGPVAGPVHFSRSNFPILSRDPSF